MYRWPARWIRLGVLEIPLKPDAPFNRWSFFTLHFSRLQQEPDLGSENSRFTSSSSGSVWVLCVFHSKYLLWFRSKSHRLNVRVQKRKKKHQAMEECHPASQWGEPGWARCRKGHKALKPLLTVVDPRLSLARRISFDQVSLFWWENQAKEFTRGLYSTGQSTGKFRTGSHTNTHERTHTHNTYTQVHLLK